MKALVFQLSYKNLAGKQGYQESSTWRSFGLIQYQFLAHSAVTVREDTAYWREDVNLLSGCVGHKRSQGGWPTACQEGSVQKLESEERLKCSFSGFLEGGRTFSPFGFPSPVFLLQPVLISHLITSKILPALESGDNKE